MIKRLYRYEYRKNRIHWTRTVYLFGIKIVSEDVVSTYPRDIYACEAHDDNNQEVGFKRR